MPVSRRFIVHGKVQGVWFRESTRQVADALGLDGHAINLPDGTVEVIAGGEEQAIEKLSAWLLEGPPMARVDRLEQFDWHGRVPEGFTTGRN